MANLDILASVLQSLVSNYPSEIITYADLLLKKHLLLMLKSELF